MREHCQSHIDFIRRMEFISFFLKHCIFKSDQHVFRISCMYGNHGDRYQLIRQNNSTKAPLLLRIKTFHICYRIQTKTFEKRL